LVVVNDASPAAVIAGLELRWAAVTVDGQLSSVSSATSTATPRASAFVTTLGLQPLDGDGAAEVALGLVLPCWTLLGMLDRALELTRTYVLGREQFGQPLASFQAVQFQLTDAEVERTGVEELAKYALWSIEAGSKEALVDALALRLAAVEAAETVFRIAHQLHGAIGFCDETTLSWVSRYSAPLRRLPYGLSGTLDHLRRRVGRSGLRGIFVGASGA
jgi:alkylation response protein AidB-like acyl-CoA dehydrogenase